MTISYVNGDLFEGIKNTSNVIIIPHVCNDLGKWGAGFVVPLGQHFPKAKDDYQEYIECLNKAPINDDVLGDTVFTKIPPKIIIANMIAQKGIGTHKKPIRYWALIKCMETVNKTAKMLKDKNITVEIHAPKFGSGLAGGNPELIEELIKELWYDWTVIIYEYKK